MSDDGLESPELDDQGFSLIDLIVATSLMSFIMVIVTGAITEVYSDVNRTDSLANARDQVGNSFRRLDKELRYATWVATPGQVGGVWYLEYATPTNCQQLVFRNGVLTRAVQDTNSHVNLKSKERNTPNAVTTSSRRASPCRCRRTGTSSSIPRTVMSAP